VVRLGARPLHPVGHHPDVGSSGRGA
jgi:hypothetical protein